MMHWRTGVIVGLILIAAGVGGLAAGWGLGWWSAGECHHIYGPWSQPGARSRVLPPVAGARTIEVEAADFAFSPAEITVKAGEVVNLALVNRGVTVHDLVIPAYRIWLVAPAGQSSTTGFRALRPGEYEFYCSVPGHREAGMVGRIVVTP